MNQLTYGALWEFASVIESGEMSVAEASEHCKSMAAKAKADAIWQGYKARRFTLRGQLRQYWRFGVPCGLSCTVYGVDIY